MLDNDAIAKVSESIGRIGKELRDQKSKFDTHENMERLILKNVEKTIQEILVEMKSQSVRYDNIMSEQRKHIDAKIDNIEKTINLNLKGYVTHNELTIVKDTAVKDAKAERDEQFNKLREKMYEEVERSKSSIFKTAVYHVLVIWAMGTVIAVLSWRSFTNLEAEYKNHVTESRSAVLHHKNGHPLVTVTPKEHVK